MTEYWGGGTTLFFLLTLYNFKNIGGGARAPPAPLVRGPCDVTEIKGKSVTDHQ